MTNNTAERIYERLRQLHDIVGGASSSQYTIDFERPGVVMAKPVNRTPPKPAKSRVASDRPAKLQGELNFG